MTGDDPELIKATIRSLQAQHKADQEELLAVKAEMVKARATTREAGPHDGPQASLLQRHGVTLLVVGLLVPVVVVLAVMLQRASTRAETCLAQLQGQDLPQALAEAPASPEPVTPPAAPARVEPHPTPAPPEPPPRAEEPPIQVGGYVGVKECDDYLAKYARCLNEGRIPPQSRQLMQRSLGTMRDAWRKAASTETGKRHMAQACRTAYETARKSMAAIKCSW